MAKNTPKPISVPSLDDVHPAYGRMVIRQRELLTRRSELETEMQRIRRGKAPKRLVAADASERAGRAAALLGDVVEGASEYKVTSKNPITLDEHYEKLSEELGDVNAALAILAAELPAAERAANEAAVAAVKPDYNAALRDLAVAVAKTAALHDRVRAATVAMNHEDVRWVGRLANPVNIGHVFGDGMDRDTRARRFIKDCVDAGIVGAHEVEAVGYAD